MEKGQAKPVLRILGHNSKVQPGLSTLDGLKHPDYVFCRDTTSLDANKNRTLNEDLGLPRRSAGTFSLDYVGYLCAKVLIGEGSESSRTPTRQATAPEGFAPFEDAHRDG